MPIVEVRVKCKIVIGSLWISARRLYGHSIDRYAQFVSLQQLREHRIKKRLLSEFVKRRKLPEINDSMKRNSTP
jgi:hypothetical protein